MKKMIVQVLAAAASLAMNAPAQALSFDDLPSSPAGVGSAVSAVTAPAASPAAEEREWLVLVFINGRNDLWSAAVADVNEMELVGSTDKVAVTVELGLPNDRGVSSRYYIVKDAAPEASDRFGAIVSPAVKVPGSDMGSWRHFADFAKWSYKKYPARKVMAVLWGHGSGRLDIGGADNSGAELGISPDYQTRNFIRNKQLGLALREIERATGKKISVYASDSCLMQMASVVYELKDGAEMIVGSEENLPGRGFPYEEILQSLVGDPGADAGTLGAAIIGKFAASYSGEGGNTTLSAVRTSELPEFVRLLNDWVRAAAVPAHRKKILEAEHRALSFEYGYDGPDSAIHVRSKDLYDFVGLVGAAADKASALYLKGEALRNFIAGRLVANNASGNAGGLAVYFPQMIYDPSYDEALFSRDSLWDDFLKWKLDPSYKVERSL